VPIRHRRRAGAATAALLTASLVLSACSGDGDGPAPEAAPSTAPTQQVTKGEQVAPETWPLTGLPVKGGRSAAARHPVMVLKMDNTSSSAPQRGLGSADLVVEELVEGGLTRLAAFFYSDIPGTVGPVRSMRASDIGIVSPVDAAVVTSGAAPITIRRIQEAGIRFFGEGAKGFFRDSSRSAPYNLMTDLAETATLVKRAATRPDDYLPWGDAADLPKGKPGRTLQARFSYGHTTTWTFENGRYRNANTYAAADDQFLADSVLVLRVRVGDAGYKDPAGNPVPETFLEGRGQALLLHGGRAISGTWTKAGLNAPIELRNRFGTLRVPAGNTWIELVPEATGSVTVG
jgi:hypothetical protein